MGVIFTLLCILIEFTLCQFGLRNDLYRLLCIRYLFLIFLGMVWARRGIELNALTIVLSIVSIIFISLFRYTDIRLERIFYFSIYSWEDCHWICYFYPAFVFMFLLRQVYQRLPCRVQAIVNTIGHYSWQIFLMQMFFFALFPKDKLMMMGDYKLMLLIFSAFAFAFSIVPVLLYYRITNGQRHPSQQ